MMENNAVVHHRRYNVDDIENRSHASVEPSTVSRVSSNNQASTVSETFDKLADRYRFSFLLVTVFLAFWPYYAGNHDTTLEQSILRSSLNYGTMFYESGIVSLSLLVPLVFDVILEVVHDQSERRKVPTGSVHSVLSSQTPSVTGKSLLEVREKILIYAGFASTPLLIFVRKDYPNLAMLWFCTTRFQLLAVYGSVWISFCRLDDKAWPSWTVFLGLTFFTIGLHLTMYNTMFGIQGPLLYVAAILKYIAIYGFFTVPALRYLFLGFFKSLTRLSVLPLMYTLTTTVSFLVAIIVMTAIGSYDNLSNVGLLLYNGAMILLELGFLMFYMHKEKVKSIFDELIAEMQRERETLLQHMDAAAQLIIYSEENIDDQMSPDDDDNTILNVHGVGKEIATGDHVLGKPSSNQSINNYHHIALIHGNGENKAKPMNMEKDNNYPSLSSSFPSVTNVQKSLSPYPSNICQKTPVKRDMAALQHAYRQAKNAANVDTNVSWEGGRTSPRSSGAFGVLHKLDRNNFECESSLTSRSAGAAPLVYRLQMMNPFGNGVNHRKQKGTSHVVVDTTKGNTITNSTNTTISPHLSLLSTPMAGNNHNAMIYGNHKIEETDENEDEGSSFPDHALPHNTNITKGFDFTSPATNMDTVSSPATTQTLSYVENQHMSDRLSSSSSLPSKTKVQEVEDDMGGFVVTLPSNSQIQLPPLPSQLPLPSQVLQPQSSIPSQTLL